MTSDTLLARRGRIVLAVVSLCAGLLLPGCATAPGHGAGPPAADRLGQATAFSDLALSDEVQERILALDPELVTGQDLDEVLSHAPAPRIINIHGGILPLPRRMISFSKFLIGMGYPEASIRNPGDGSYTFGYYESSKKLAGLIAWYYEREGLRPMIVGHSQGGIQAVRVLHKLAGHSGDRLAVWNPLTCHWEERFDITDPLTGRLRSVVGLQVSYATASVAGGLARILPNQWDMNTSLRKIPDSVEEFTGFQKRLDPIGGDFLGYGSANDYRPTGCARVRNVRLPAAYGHTALPDTEHLLKSQEIKDWINRYQPSPQATDEPRLDVVFDSDSSHILWAAEVWHAIKKHWVLELQRLIQAKRSLNYGQ